MEKQEEATYNIHSCDDRFLIQHAEELADLCRRAFKEHADKGVNFGPITMTAERFAQRANQNVGHYAEHNGKIIAFFNAKPNWLKKTVEGDILAVDPSYKGKHIGINLTNAFLESLAEMGLKVFVTDTSLNAPHVVAFHKKYGCKAVGMKHFYKRNYYSVLLRKALDPEYEISDNQAKCKYLLSSAFCKSTVKLNGDFTLFGKMIYKEYGKFTAFGNFINKIIKYS